MLASIIRFEWRYHTRQISFVASVATFLLIGFVLAGTGFGAPNLKVNSPYNITESLGLASLAAVFVLAVFCANAVLRDRDFQMEEIVFTTAVEKFQYLFGRFAGSFLAAFTAFSATVGGMLIALAMPWQDPARVGPVHLLDYLWPLFVLVLPGMLVAAAALFAVATLTRSLLGSVVAAVAIYILYFVVAALTNSPLMAASRPGADTFAAAALLDPFGLSAFFEQTRYWTAVERNGRLIALRGTFLANRVLCLAGAVLIWLVVFSRFSFRLLAGKTESKGEAGKKTRDETGSGTDGRRYQPAGVSPSGTAFQWRAFISSVRLELRSFGLSVPFLLLTLLWAGLAVSEMLSDIGGGEYGSALYPTTGFLLSAIQQPLSLVGAIVLIYYSAEMIWRERTVGMAEMLDATPPSGAVFVFSKWLALSALMCVLVAVGIASAVVVQLTHDYTRVQPEVMFGFASLAVVPLVLLAMAAVLIQTFSPQKYAGLMIVVLAALYMRIGAGLGLEHPLLRFGAAPLSQYSEMNGFGPLAGYSWFTFLWVCTGVLFLILAAAGWRHSGRSGRTSAGEAWRSQAAGGRRLATALILVVAAVAAFIFYNTNVRNDWSSSSSGLQWKADYEKKYKPITERMAVPRVEAIKVDAALYPKQRRYRITGENTLVNDSGVPIEKILVSVRRDALISNLAVSSARASGVDERFGQYWFRFQPPLAPGARTALQFDLTFDNPGFAADGEDNSIARNGSFILEQRCIPSVGYRKGYEIADASQRKKEGLPPKPVNEAGEESAGADAPPRDEWVSVDFTLSTDGDQIAVAPGTLEKQWSADGRRYFHYRESWPVHHAFAFTSGRYAQAKANVGAVAVEVDYDPDHAWNVPRMLSAASASLKYFGENFGPYPHHELRIVEVPSYWPFAGYAHPGVIYLVETRSFLTDARDPERLDLVTRRVAHEVAHQWWGHVVSPAPGPGASAIVETLAKYSELMILEKTHGRPEVQKSLAAELDLYLAGRTAAEGEERPLTEVGDEAWLYYRKGAVVLYAIRDLLGESAMNDALRKFVATEGGPGHHPHAADLVHRLSENASDAQRALISQWMTEVILYDISIQSASARRLADGRYETTITVAAGKSRASGGPAPEFNEELDVAIYGSSSEQAATGSVLHLARHRLHAGVNTIAVIVAGKPLEAAVDPFLTRIDRNRLDNRREISAVED